MVAEVLSAKEDCEPLLVGTELLLPGRDADEVAGVFLAARIEHAADLHLIGDVADVDVRALGQADVGRLFRTAGREAESGRQSDCESEGLTRGGNHGPGV